MHAHIGTREKNFVKIMSLHFYLTNVLILLFSTAGDYSVLSTAGDYSVLCTADDSLQLPGPRVEKEQKLIISTMTIRPG